jgi:hypothetical protein
VKDVVASTLRALSSRTLLVGGRDESAGAGAAEHRERVAAERLVEHGLEERAQPSAALREIPGQAGMGVLPTFRSCAARA